MEDVSTGEKSMFPCNRWLADDEDDKQLIRELTCAPASGSRPGNTNVFKKLNNFCEFPNQTISILCCLVYSFFFLIFDISNFALGSFRELKILHSFVQNCGTCLYGIN